MPDNADPSNRLVDYRLEHLQGGLQELKQQLSAQSLSVTTSIGALSGQINNLVDSLPERYPTRREYEAALETIRQQDAEVGAELREIRTQLDALSSRDAARGWALAATLLASAIALVVSALNLASRVGGGT